MSLLDVANLHAYYGKSHVLHGVQMNVQPGEIVALLGRNGSGRSTTVKAIMGLVDGTGNTIAVLRNHTMTTPIGASCVKHGSVMPCRCFETDPKRNQRTMQAAPWFSALVDAYVG
mgnify:CR=1 FL=1